MMNSIKCVTVGDGAVGKTCLLISYSTDQFNGDYVPTVFDNYMVNMMHENEVVQLQLWDTAGQDDYDRLRPLSYPETDVFVICYSVDNPTSYENVMHKWYPEVSHFSPSTPIVLVANKTDMLTDPKAQERMANHRITPVSTAKGEELRAAIGAVAFVECSALTSKNVNAVFNASVTAVKSKRSHQPRKRRMMCTIM